MNRCEWAIGEEYISYHDNEWGRPLHDDQQLFEFLILEGMQAGLSWITILKKRNHMRKVFDNFDPHIISNYSEEKLIELMNDKGIIRNRRKIDAAVINAEKFLEVQKEFGTFDKFIWSFVGGSPICNKWEKIEEVPAQTKESEAMSKKLKSLGFKFVGPTICYAFMQATGMVNDHLVSCISYEACKEEGRKG